MLSKLRPVLAEFEIANEKILPVFQKIAKKLLTIPFFFAIIYVLRNNGVWLSLVERLVRDQEAGSSNLLTPTKISRNAQ